MKYVLMIALNLFLARSYAQQIEITTKNGTEREETGKLQLQRILDNYQAKISQWIYTDKVQIDDKAIPHSHPLLTLHCRHLDNDEIQLSTFLHEQFHWLVEETPVQEKQAITEFKILFPEVPSPQNGGARDPYSTYLHLIVCDLEFQAMTKITGKERAMQIMKERGVYTWVFDKIFNNNQVREINKRYGFLLK